VARKHTRKTSNELGLDLEVRDYLTAVVFDTNCFGYGRPDLGELGYLARRLREIGIVAWVPEPVAWEWAQHVGEDWDTVRVRLGDEHRRVKKAGLASFESPYGDPAAVAEAFLAKLGEVPNVIVLPLSAANAREGLRDQILQRPPGRRKEGVKTGASDSAWLRDVLEQVDGDVARVLFASEDRDVGAALKAWGKADPLMRPLDELLATLFTVTIDTGAATQVLVRYMLDNLPATQGTGTFEVGETPALQSVVEYILDAPDPDTRIDNVTIRRITKLVGIVSVAIEVADDGSADDLPASGRSVKLGKRGMYGLVEQESPHTVLATMMLLADAEAAVSHRDVDERLVTTVTMVPDILLRAEMVFDLVAGKVAAVRSEGEAAAFGYHDAYDDDVDAYNSILEEIGDVIPGLNMSDKLAVSNTFEEEINGHEVSVEYDQVDAGEWKLRVEIDDNDAELHCWYDVGARVWLGREDSFDMPGAYPVAVSIAESSNPMWALSGWIIDQIYS
jgi:hypothetical protein